MGSDVGLHKYKISALYKQIFLTLPPSLDNNILAFSIVKCLVKVCLVDVPYYIQWCQEGALWLLLRENSAGLNYSFDNIFQPIVWS